MAFTVGAIAAKDGAGTTIPGGLLAADIAGGNVGPWILFKGLVDGVAGVNKAQVTAENALKIGVGVAATSLGKAEDAAHASGDTGVMALAVRNDAGTALAGTDGDYIPLSTDNTGALRVTGGGGGTQYTEDAAAAADPVGNMMMGVRRDTLSASEVSADGDNIALKATSKGQLHVFAEITPAQVGPLATATFTYANASGNLGVQPVALPSDQVWGVGAIGFTKLEDVASADGDKGVPSMAVRQDTPANSSGADGDYEFLRMSGGRLWGSSQAYGDVAHDGVDAGNPIKIGMRAIAHGTNPTAVAAADRTDLYANRAGVQFVIGGHPNVITRSATIDAVDGAQTDASLLTIGSGSKIVVTAISAICASSNSGAVAVRIGFATATLPAATEAGAAGVLLEGKFVANCGNQKGNGAGILGVGADGEDLRITCDSPTGGSLFVTFSYYTIES